MDVLFLDANILFSAAYRPDAGVRRLWELEVERVSSEYALDEARRNLATAERSARLDELTTGMRIHSGVPDRSLPRGIELPEKDVPILLAAIHARATHLVTGDVSHFGPYFGLEFDGVRIVPPARYLAARASRD